MLGYYNIYATTFHNGVKISTQCCGCIICEESQKNKTLNLTWENLSDMMQSYGLDFGFTTWHFKKGRLVSFFHPKMRNKNTWDIKEWKYKDLNIQICYEYRPIVCYSIQDILDYHDAKLAKKFLEQIKE